MPTCSALIIKELKEPVRQRRKVKGAIYKHTGNLSFEQVKTIAKKMAHKTLAREFKGTVKEVLGSCLAVGITVDGKSPKEVTKEVDNGQHNL
jgi:large subunit ribosomal protein L12e